MRKVKNKVFLFLFFFCFWKQFRFYMLTMYANSFSFFFFFFLFSIRYFRNQSNCYEFESMSVYVLPICQFANLFLFFSIIDFCAISICVYIKHLLIIHRESYTTGVEHSPPLPFLLPFFISFFPLFRHKATCLYLSNY